MDTQSTSLPLDLRKSHPVVSHAIPTPMVADELDPEVSQESYPSLDWQLGGRLSFEFSNYALKLPPQEDSDTDMMLPETQGSHYTPLASAFAAPLVPLQSRDHTILAGLFDRDDMHEIHLDITNQLSKMIAEPCWDESAHDASCDV